MPIDTSKPNQKLDITNDQILFEEGSVCNSLNILHEGSYTLEKKIDGILFPLLENSGKNLTPGVISLFTTERYTTTIHSSSKGCLSTYQITRATIKKNIMAKSSLGVAISKTLLKEVLDSQKRANNIFSLNSKIEKIMDNLSISYYFLNPSNFKEIDPNKFHFSDEDIEKDAVVKLVKRNLSKFLEGGGKSDFLPSLNFLSNAHPEFFKKEYSETENFGDKEFVLIRKILSLQQALQNTIFEADITILIQMCEKLAETFSTSLEKVEENIKILHHNLILLIGKEGLIEKFYNLIENFETGGIPSLKAETLLPVVQYIQSEINPHLETYKALFHMDFDNIFDKFSKIKEKVNRLENKVSAPESKEEKISITEDFSAIYEELEHSAAKIFNFVKYTQDQIREYSALILKLKSMKNPMDPEQDARTIRKNITRIYWDVYGKAIQSYIQSPGSTPKPVDLMLKYGYFDETLLNQKNQVFLYKLNLENNSNSEIPLHLGPEWLDQVAKKKIPTSISELGESYFDKIKADSKDVVYKKESDVPDTVDTLEKRLRYEIDSMYQPNVRLVTGNPTVYLPILTDYHIVTPLEKSILSHSNLTQALNEILKIDYTAFNREVVYNNEKEGILKELIHISVIPDFVAVPSIGSKIMMWQDLSVTRGAGSKESRGRIIMPIFAQSDLKTMLMEAIAAFRWELCKSIMGVEWNNVGVPSLTAEYTDYVMFYKKNRDLSIELKEKIASDFKRFRTDRDKFTNDYILWLKYESEGIQKLNKVVRSTFYKYIPFHKEIRDKVSTQPAFADIHTRFTNIRTRQYKELEAKYRKYQESHGGVIPPKIQANLDFYKV